MRRHKGICFTKKRLKWFWGWILTVRAHSHLKALLKTAILAPVSMMFRYFTVLSPSTGVAELLPNWSLEKTFASFTTNGTVVSPYKLEEWFYLITLSLSRRRRTLFTILPEARSPQTTQTSSVTERVIGLLFFSKSKELLKSASNISIIKETNAYSLLFNLAGKHGTYRVSTRNYICTQSHQRYLYKRKKKVTADY